MAEERAAAGDAIAALHLTPVLFELGARPHPPQELYRSYLEQSHVFVGIWWESYGWVAPGADVSGLEDEYRHSARKPRLLYVKEPAEHREPRLDEFLARLQDEGRASYKTFETTDQLRELVSRDLALLMTERFHADDDAATRMQTLPAQSTTFVGRRAELAEIERLVGDAGVRLLTLTGPGGIGKTRVAVEAAALLQKNYADGVGFAPLDGLESAELVASTIVAALGILDLGGDPLARLLAHLRGRRTLLLLDNFEHVMAAAPLVAELLQGVPGLTVVVTSRELLRLRGEHELRVPPLPLETEAAMLFTERAAAARHRFELRVEDVPVVTEVCRRLDCVPLAIELAAPYLRLLSPEQLLDRLRERFEPAGPRDAPSRQRTLRSAIEWSYELLDPDERRVFERLSIFHGSFTIEAADEIASDGESDVLELLSALLDKSIVYRLPTSGETRFGMLRTIREYALGRLVESGGLEAAQERFASYYLRLALQAEDGFRSPLQRQWKQTVDLEIDNFRAVLGWAAEWQRAAELSVLMQGLWIWFWLHGNLEEAGDWAKRGLACADGIDGRDRGWLLVISGAFRVLRSDLAAGIEELANAEMLLAEAGDRRGGSSLQGSARTSPLRRSREKSSRRRGLRSHSRPSKRSTICGASAPRSTRSAG